MGNTNERVCAIYTRVSTEEQAKKGYSLSEQKKRLTDYCEYNDFIIYKYYEDDGISAKTGNYRPAFEQMIKDGKDKKFDTILAIKLDRISRSVYDMEVINKMLSDNELDLICIFESFDTTNANGRMVQRIMTSVAQNEIERTSERTKIGMDGAIKAGHIPGKTPTGYRRENKCLVVDPVTSLVVKKIFEMYSRGNSQFIIAQELTKEQALGKKEWKDSSVRRIIDNPVYKGCYINNRGKKDEKRYDDICPAIVSKELWEYCQAQAPKNLRHYKRNKEYIFLQKLSCPTCGRILGGKATRKKNGNEYYYYHCMFCKNNINEDSIEKQMIHILNDIFEYDAVVNSYYFPLIKTKLVESKHDYSKDMNILNMKKERITDAYINGSFDLDTYNRKKEEIDKEILQLEKIILENGQLSQMTFSPDDLLLMRDLQFINKIKLPMLYDKFLDVWKNCDRKRKSNIVMDFIDHIDLKQVDGKVLADKVYFRDCFYENFNQLFLDGYLDVPILQPGPNNNLENKIRFSTYRPEEDVIKHLDKLRKYYKVDLFTGTMDFDKGKIDHIMPYDYDYVRIFPDEKIKYDNGFHGTHPVNILGVLKENDDLTDKDFDVKLIDKKIKMILSELTDSSIDEIKSFTNN